VEGGSAMLHHVYRMLSADPVYREHVVDRLAGRKELAFVHAYWATEFPQLAADRSFAAARFDPPKNKLARLITALDVALHHPHQLNLDEIVERGETLIVTGAKAAAGEDNTRLMGQLVLQLV